MDPVRVSTWVVMACLITIGWTVGLSVGRAYRRSRIRFRLFKKPDRTSPVVLVPAGPTPRLVPGDSPNATRAKRADIATQKPTPARTQRMGMIDYIAAFADSEASGEGTPVDYLLVAEESTETTSEIEPDRGDG